MKNDTLSLPGYEDRLWSELEQLHAEQRNENGSSRPSARGPGKSRRRYLTAVVTLAAAASIAAVALIVRQSDNTTSTADESQTQPTPPPSTESDAAAEPGRGPTTPPPSEPAAPGSADAPDSVHVAEWSKPNGLNGTNWTDEGSGWGRSVTRNADGALVYEQRMNYGFTADLGIVNSHVLVIDHAARTYYESPAVDEGPAVTNRIDDEIRGDVGRGYLVVDGLETIDGRQLLRLVSARDGVADPDPHLVVWVEQDSYRPVRSWSRVTAIENGTESTSTHTYLPRTAENLRLVELAVPEGYTKVNRMPIQPN